jgi:hypothetical protein
VLDAISPGSAHGADEFDLVHMLAEFTGFECPPQLANLASKQVRFADCCAKNEMEEKVLKVCVG